MALSANRPKGAARDKGRSMHVLFFLSSFVALYSRYLWPHSQHRSPFLRHPHETVPCCIRCTVAYLYRTHQGVLIGRFIRGSCYARTTGPSLRRDFRLTSRNKLPSNNPFAKSSMDPHNIPSNLLSESPAFPPCLAAQIDQPFSMLSIHPSGLEARHLQWSLDMLSYLLPYIHINLFMELLGMVALKVCRSGPCHLLLANTNTREEKSPLLAVP